MLNRQMPLNIQLNWIKTEAVLQGWSGLQFIKFDFVTGGQLIKIAILVEF